MAWIRYKKLHAKPEGVHRISNRYEEVLFDVKKDDGLVDIKRKQLIDYLIRTGDYEVALERYGIEYDADGFEKEIHVSGVVEESETQEAGIKRRGRHKKVEDGLSS